jgi:hypothetical protein
VHNARTAHLAMNAPARPLLSAPTLSTNGQFRVVLSGDVGPDYTVQISTNLLNWTPLFTTNFSLLPAEFLESSASNNSARFYRALLGP